MRVTVHRLSNGLTVYLSPNSQEPRVAAQIAVRAGAAQDPADSTGMAHYLEHMLFKGSRRLGTLDYEKEKRHLDRIEAAYEELFLEKDPERRKALYARIDAENILASQFAVPNELDRLYRSLGFEGVNAFTGQEQTVYMCNFPSNRAEVWARTEAERFSRPVFRLFQTELETVYEEKNRSLDNADRILGEALERAVYREHPYGRAVLGSVEHLKNPSLAKMYAFYDAYYRPNNMAIVLSGDFDREAMLELLKRNFGVWKPADPPGGLPAPASGPKGAERVEVRYESEERVTLAWPAMRNGEPDADALVVMDMLLDNSQAGILNLVLNQQQRVKASGSFPALLNKGGAWYLWAVPKKGQTLDEAEGLLLQAVGTLQQGAFTEADMRAVLTDFEVREKLRLESNEARAGLMTASFVQFEEWAHTASRLERLRAVTKEDVLRTARKHLGGDRVVAYRRDGKPEIPAIPKPRFTNIRIDPRRESAFFKRMRALPARPLEPRWLLPERDYAVRRHPWGKLYAARNPVNDLFSLTFHFDRGRRHARELCAALDLLDLSGAGPLSAEAFKRRLYAMGTEMSLACGDETSSVSVSGLEAQFEASLELLLRRFESPSIATDTLKKMIEVRIGARADGKKDPGVVFHALAEYAMRGRESEVLSDLSDPELRALVEERLRELLRRFFDYERRVAYVGVRSPQGAASLLGAGRGHFLPAPGREPRSYVQPLRARVLFAHRDMVQSRIGLYAADRTLDPREAVDVQFFNAYMGGMSGVIFQEIREARALAYSAGGGYAPGERLGDQNVLLGRAGTQADKTVEAASLLRDLLLRVPASGRRFREAASGLEQDYRSDAIQFRAVPGTLIAWEDMGLKRDPRPERFQRVLRYRLEDLLRFAGRFRSRPATLYLLGHRDRAGFPGLRALGEVEEKKIDDLFPY